MTSLLAMEETARYFPRMTTAGSVTAEELATIRLAGRRFELVKGRLLVREPAGYRHGRVAAAVVHRLMDYVESGGRGHVFAAETGFKITSRPDTVRAPDAAYISTDRLPDPEPDGYAEIAPNLIVEVLSPNDRPGEVHSKVGDWLTAGVLLIWVVDPTRRIVRIYRADGSESTVSGDGVIEGENALPGFTCPLERLLPLP